MIEHIVTAIVGMICGNVTALLLFPQKRKSETLKNEAQNIENEAKQSDEWCKLYQEELGENKELNKKIDSLYAEIAKHRDENARLHIEMTEVKVENTRLKVLKCEIPACGKRQPPTGY